MGQVARQDSTTAISAATRTVVNRVAVLVLASPGIGRYVARARFGHELAPVGSEVAT
jgi:hypothetical protein